MRGRLVTISAPRPLSGKTEIIKLLTANKWFKRVRFSAVMSEMIRPWLLALGYSEEEIDVMLDGDKTAPLRGLEDGPDGPVTLRMALKDLGTKWGRSLHPEMWVRLWETQVERLLASGCNVACDDCRFPNEYESAGRMNALRIFITRQEAPPLEDDHPSEGQLDSYRFEAEITNNGSLEELAWKVDLLMDGWRGPKGYRAGPDEFQLEGSWVKDGEVKWIAM